MLPINRIQHEPCNISLVSIVKRSPHTVLFLDKNHPAQLTPGLLYKAGKPGSVYSVFSRCI